ncbi:hypothetical protein PUN28_003512 [Cardiocondyla obscurior]|uniref:Uncharacterized protein n=1 Tax=Cardiocondyla obscurior TaxID=286306 RepID=A0AAW2GNS4_9HYME
MRLRGSVINKTQIIFFRSLCDRLSTLVEHLFPWTLIIHLILLRADIKRDHREIAERISPLCLPRVLGAVVGGGDRVNYTTTQKKMLIATTFCNNHICKTTVLREHLRIVNKISRVNIQGYPRRHPSPHNLSAGKFIIYKRITVHLPLDRAIPVCVYTTGIRDRWVCCAAKQRASLYRLYIRRYKYVFFFFFYYIATVHRRISDPCRPSRSTRRDFFHFLNARVCSETARNFRLEAITDTSILVPANEKYQFHSFRFILLKRELESGRVIHVSSAITLRNNVITLALTCG